MEFYLEGLLHEIGLVYIIKCNSLHEGTNVEKNKRIKTKVEMVTLHTGRLLFSSFNFC